MKRDDNEVGLLAPPLKVMFSSYLNWGGKSKRKGNDGLIVGNMEELGGLEAFILKSSKLSIRPPVFGPRHYVQQLGRVGWERASGKFRGNY